MYASGLNMYTAKNVREQWHTDYLGSGIILIPKLVDSLCEITNWYNWGHYIGIHVLFYDYE